ncbi:MAG: hypothetical protein U5L11_00415 [Arhodomonas sp.]|nr:hypothetical protein [Arhodomonas sp.]
MALALVLATLLAVEAYWLEDWRHRVKAEARQPVPEAEPPAPNEIWAPAEELVAAVQVDDMVARPLFTPTRRPPEPEPEPDPEPEEPKAGKLNLRLSSIVVTPDKQVALARIRGKMPPFVSARQRLQWLGGRCHLPGTVIFESDRGVEGVGATAGGPAGGRCAPDAARDTGAAAIRRRAQRGRKRTIRIRFQGMTA